MERLKPQAFKPEKPQVPPWQVPPMGFKGSKPEYAILWAFGELKYQEGVDFFYQSLTGESKVLMANLTWKKMEDVKEDDAVISVDQEKGKSTRYKWTTGKVTSIIPYEEEVFSVKFDSGIEVVTTKQHPWLCPVDGKRSTYGWRSTEKLPVGHPVPQFIEVWETDTSYDAGWLAGMYDGEGSFVQSIKDNGSAHTSLSMYQRESPTIRKAEKLLREKGISHKLYSYPPKDGNQQMCVIQVRGGQAEVMKVLGSIRPERLLEKFSPEKLGKIQAIKQHKVVSVTPVGKRTVYGIGVDKGTYFADGFCMHNSPFEGGRLFAGGGVLDFWVPATKIGIRVQGLFWHYGRGGDTKAYDAIQRVELESLGVTVVDIDEDAALEQPVPILKDALMGIDRSRSHVRR